ncbi:MAG: FAD-dependent oxidoreductase [Actinomycetota bacterium]
MRVGVIGAGITGLALADQFARSGAEVTVFERGHEVGGLAGGFEVLPGIRLEHFYHHMFQTDTDIQTLMTELGIADSLRWNPVNIGFYIDDGIARLSTPADVLRFRSLPVLSRLALGWTMLELQRRPTQGGLARITVEQFFRRRLARKVFDTMWAPMYEAKWGPDARKISAAWMWQKVRARGRSRRGAREELAYPIGGFGGIAEALAVRAREAAAKICLGVEIERITTHDGRVTGVETSHGAQPFDAVLSTLPLPNLLKLIALPEPAASICAGIAYRGVVCHVLVMDRPLSDIYWLNIADSSIPLGGIVEHTNFVPADHYEGKHIAYLFNYLSQDAPELTMDDDAFIGHHFPHVKKIFPAFAGAHVERRFVFRTRFATPVYRHPYQQPPQQPMPGLWLADTSQIFPMDRGTSECIRLARHLARQALGLPSTAPRPI